MELDYDQLLAVAVEVGYRLMESGGETYRVEESMQHILHAYGVFSGEIFAIPNCIIVSLAAPDGRPFTRIRRMPSHGTDIDELERYNDLCRRLCRERPPLEEARRQLEEQAARRRIYRPLAQLLGNFLGCGAFAIFFGGGLRDGLCGGLCGVAIGLCLMGISRVGTNLFFKTVAGGAVSALVAVLLTALGLGLHTSVVIIGGLMALVPGIAITNALRDIMAGDMVAGISKGAEALLIAAAIALGTALALGLTGMPGGGPAAAGWTSPLLPCLCAFVACCGFCVLYNIHGVGMLICSLGGALGWLAYLLFAPLVGSDIVQSFLAALVVSAWAEIMARLRKCPVTSYLLIALFPLVPGGGIYYTMEHAMAGETALFLESLLHTLGLAGALAVGALLTASFVRLLTALRRRA